MGLLAFAVLFDQELLTARESCPCGEKLSRAVFIYANILK